MGAPVMAFCRIDDKEIRLREPVIASDALIIQDPTLLHQVDLFKGLHPDGYVLINSLRRCRDADLAAGSLYPPLAQIREVSAQIAAAVAGTAYAHGHALAPEQEDLLAFVKSQMYEPTYREYLWE